MPFAFLAEEKAKCFAPANCSWDQVCCWGKIKVTWLTITDVGRQALAGM